MFVHNHSSGDIQPCKEDILPAKRRAQAGEVLGIQVIDCSIGDGGHLSFKDKGLLQGPS